MLGESMNQPTTSAPEWCREAAATWLINRPDHVPALARIIAAHAPDARKLVEAAGEAKKHICCDREGCYPYDKCLPCQDLLALEKALAEWRK